MKHTKLLKTLLLHEKQQMKWQQHKILHQNNVLRHCKAQNRTNKQITFQN